MRAAAGALLLPLLLPLAGCAGVVRYSDELIDSRTGRSLLVRTPATFGGIVGFVIGVPLDLVALPATGAVYALQDAQARDPQSTLLFPSFVLWHAGTLIGVPFDLVDWLWRPADDGPGPEERERIEHAFDQQEWPQYPVRPIYPRPAGG